MSILLRFRSPLPSLLGLSLIILWGLCGRALADPQFYHAAGAPALGGFDVVSYFSDATPLKGDPSQSVLWKGVVWQFSSQRNRERFEADPRAFAPQYGGYCAYGVSKGLLLDTDPTVWKVHEGKLYMIHSPEVRPIWAIDIPGHVRAADRQWPAVLAGD